VNPPNFFFYLSEAPQTFEPIAGLPANGAILPDPPHKNNEQGLRNPAAGLNNWPLTGTIGHA
jgi:hypothetical protein